MRFTAHNIRLADGTETLPEWPLLEETGEFQTALRTLRVVVPPGGALRDLGALEAGYAIGFARAGYRVLAIEGQEANAAAARFAITRSSVTDVTLAHDDVRNLEAYGPCDAVFASGILYHLNDPVALLHSAAKVAHVLYLNTHYAPDEDNHPGVDAYGLSPVETHHGYRGRWFPEVNGPWSSVGNTRSFWLCRRDLLQALDDAGFRFLAEPFGHLEPDFLRPASPQVTDRSQEPRARALFLAIRP